MGTPLIKDDANYLRQVREQYENYPYPPRDPEKEKIELKFAQACALDYLNHYHFNGKRDFTKNFRALVAGGGTGDAIIMLAEQLRDTTAELVYLDFSESSMNVAKERAKIRGLTNIVWLHGSLLDVRKLVSGEFDYIDCIGVLHHLESPEAGLAALATVLKQGGVMGLMVYARYGRARTYQLQELMRIVNHDEKNMQRRVDNCKAILRQFPYRYKEVDDYGDVGIYDLFLHSHDVSYSVPEVYAFLATSGLQPTHFFTVLHPEGNALYNLENYIKDPQVLDIANHLDIKERQAVAELMNSKISVHAFYASRSAVSVPSPEDEHNVPSLSISMDKNDFMAIHNLLQSVDFDRVASFNLYGKRISFISTPVSRCIFQFIDGHKTIGEIFEAVSSAFTTQKRPSLDDIKNEFLCIYNGLNMNNFIFLRHQSVPGTITVPEIQRRVLQSGQR